MPQALSKHDAVWVRQLAAELERRGHAVDRLLKQVGLDRQMLDGEATRIPFAKHAAFFELAAEVTDDPALGFNFAQTRDTRDAGLIGYVGLASPVVIDALNNLARYHRVFSDAVEIDTEELGDHGMLRWSFRGIDPHRSRQCIEFSAANLIRAVRELCGRQIELTQVAFTHAGHAGAASFETFFGCLVKFGSDANMIVIDPADLRLPIVTADDRLLAILRSYCHDVLERSREPTLPLVERLERVIADRLASGEPQLAAVASDLGMSSRSLSRHLAEQNTSFKAVLANLRRELALTYLRDDNLSLTEIAFLLGYAEISAFSHAFRRWTGAPPSSVRAQWLG